METITRKQLVYPSGLGFYCINHVLGCSHGCRYPCYAFSMARRHGRVKTYAEWCRPRLVANALELLRKELPKLKGKTDTIHLCLTTDPFMTGYPEVAAMSLAIIDTVNAAGLACDVLTKGVLPLELAEPRYSRVNRYGISIVSLDEEFRKRWEPQAAPYAERIAGLRGLHDRSCRTYAHIEPYPTPNIIQQDLDALLRAIGFVDEIYFSGWNYNPMAQAYPDREGFYRAQAEKIRLFCEQSHKQCEF